MEYQTAARARLVSVFKLSDTRPRLAVNGGRKAASARQLALASEEWSQH